MKVVALEEHFITDRMMAAWSSLDAAHRDPNVGEFDADKIRARLHDLADLRLQAMDNAGVDVQVLSLCPPATQSLEPDEAVPLAKEVNDLIARTVQHRPDRFQGFATLPTCAPEAAADELRRAVNSLHLRGALLAGRTRERNFDHPDSWPIYQAAAELRVPLYLHPQTPVSAVRQAYYSGYDDALNVNFATFGWGWHIETGIQAVRLILSGALDRFPDLQIILGHWGEMVPFYLERIEKMSDFAKGLQRPIGDYVRQNFYVTPSGMLSPTYLTWAKQIMGMDRIMFATDYPFVIAPGRAARDFLTNAALTAEEKEKVASKNWEQLTARHQQDH